MGILTKLVELEKIERAAELARKAVFKSEGQELVGKLHDLYEQEIAELEDFVLIGDYQKPVGFYARNNPFGEKEAHLCNRHSGDMNLPTGVCFRLGQQIMPISIELQVVEPTQSTPLHVLLLKHVQGGYGGESTLKRFEAGTDPHVMLEAMFGELTPFIYMAEDELK